MHVLIVANGMPSAQNDLRGIFEWDQAKAISKTGLEVDFFSVDLRSLRQIRPLGLRHGIKDGVRWHSVSIPVGAIHRPLLCKIGALALKELYRIVFEDNGKKTDIVHAHSTEVGCMSAYLVKEKGLPLVITEHSSAMVQPMISDDLRRIAEIGYSGADCVIAVSNFLKDAIYRYTGVVAQVVPNIVSSEFCYGKYTHKGMKFVSVANLNHGKRINVLVKAFAQLFKKYKDISLEIVGDGNLREHLERLASEERISDEVKFYGALPRQDINNLYKSCDCFVLPSAFETFGVAYIEAMAAGLPVIATRCGGPEDFVEESNGILVPIDDVDALADAMAYIYKNRNYFSGIRISESIKEQFSGDVVVKKILHIYDGILGAHGKD